MVFFLIATHSTCEFEHHEPLLIADSAYACVCGLPTKVRAANAAASAAQRLRSRRPLARNTVILIHRGSLTSHGDAEYKRNRASLILCPFIVPSVAGARGDMTGITIFNDHVLFHEGMNVNSKEPHPSIDGLPLSKFADLALRWGKYSDYLLRTQKTAMRKSSDYEGLPREDFYDIYFNVTTDAYTESADPRIHIAFHDTDGDDFDYAGIGRVTPRQTSDYKSGPKGELREIKFKIYRAVINRQKGDADTWFRDELTRLEVILDDLDQATRTLRSWADSGLSMKVYCPGLFCRTYDPGVIGNDQLLLHADKGLSLDDFKQKLKCKVCGARCSGMSVV